ncbi:hypothetical protein QTP88_013617 [Uroleucon formosanum]
METPAARVFRTTRSVRVVYARFIGRLPAPPLHAGGGGGGDDDGLAESRIDKPAAGSHDCGGCCSRANVNGHRRLRLMESLLRCVAPTVVHARSLIIRIPHHQNVSVGQQNATYFRPPCSSRRVCRPFSTSTK